MSMVGLSNTNPPRGPRPMGHSATMEQRAHPHAAPPQTTPQYKYVRDLYAHSKPVTCMRFSFDGEFLVSGSADRVVCIWHVDSFRLVAFLEGHLLGINDVTFSYDKKIVASASDDGTLRTWDVDNRKVLKVFRGHSNYVYCCSMSPSGYLLASGGCDQTVRIWDVKTATCVRSMDCHNDIVTSVSFNRAGNFLSTSGLDCVIRVFENKSGRQVAYLTEYDNCPVANARFSPNGKYLLSAQLGTKKHPPSLKLWELSKSRCLKHYFGHKQDSYIVPACFSVTGGKFVVTGSDDGKVFLWNLQTSDIVQRIDAFQSKPLFKKYSLEQILCVECHPSRNLIAVTTLDEGKYMIKLFASDV